MKKTSDFRFWSRIGTGIFCLIVIAAFYIKAAIIKPEVSVSRFDTNASGVPDVLRVYFDGKLQRELIDFSWNDVYTYRIFWSEMGGVRRIERMIDVKKWIYEYYHDPVNVDGRYITQNLNFDKTFHGKSFRYKDYIVYDNVKLFVSNRHIFAAEFYTKGKQSPFLLAFYDKYGRFSEIYRDLDANGVADEKLLYEGGILVARVATQENLSFDKYQYIYGDEL